MIEYFIAIQTFLQIYFTYFRIENKFVCNINVWYLNCVGYLPTHTDIV